ncbi:MAG: NAD(P)H-quinone dehydrogenase [Actinobacteria bacterium]|nr:NAD(P)H-quinone dehydrogenase [Actinomycetota bacterium]MCA1719850.1 NAD(P)H-quinone dehydrogenase [Actinomycetota bacterium]
MTRIAIVGGGPAGYEAALVAVQLGAEVTLVDRDGVGGQCVLSDCVPSKTFIATSEAMTSLSHADRVGVHSDGAVTASIAEVHARVKTLALAQSADITRRLSREGVTLLQGEACLRGGGKVEVGDEVVEADVVLVATGARPRVVGGAEPDGERVLDWRQLYDLPELPSHLVVIGSGVTGAEFANAYLAMGCQVSLVSSRERVLPGEDSDAAELLQTVFERRGMDVVRGRAASVARAGDGVVVTLTDGRTVAGSHALMTVGSVPNTAGLGLEEVGVTLTDSGFVQVDRVSRTTAPGVYAAGDCTGVLMLASVAAMQGRIAMWHALGEAVSPLRLGTVAANVFTDPEVASVGVSQTAVESGAVQALTVTLPLGTNARAKMQGITDGFVKVFCRPGSGTVLGGVVVAPRASELILSLSLAVQHGLTADQVAHTFAIYPSLSGSLTEAARQLMLHDV